MIKYELLNNGETLIVKYVGKVSKNDLISFFKYCSNQNYLLSLKEVLADYREATDVFNFKELNEITDARKNISSGFSSMKTIFLVKSPEDTATALLFSELYKGHSLVTICSTTESCLQALSAKLAHHELIKVLDNPAIEFSA